MFLSVKLKNNEHSKDSTYKNRINSLDFRQVAILLTDLETFNVPIDKAIQEYKKLKAREFPW